MELDWSRGSVTKYCILYMWPIQRVRQILPKGHIPWDTPLHMYIIRTPCNNKGSLSFVSLWTLVATEYPSTLLSLECLLEVQVLYHMLACCVSGQRHTRSSRRGYWPSGRAGACTGSSRRRRARQPVVHLASIKRSHMVTQYHSSHIVVMISENKCTLQKCKCVRIRGKRGDMIH
jgi:hypothetical protein